MNADKWAVINLWTYPLNGGFGMRSSQLSPKRLPGLIRDYIGDSSHCHVFNLVEGQDINQELKALMNESLRTLSVEIQILTFWSTCAELKGLKALFAPFPQLCTEKQSVWIRDIEEPFLMIHVLKAQHILQISHTTVELKMLLQQAFCRSSS